MALPALGGELTQIQGVGVAGVAAVGGQESEQRHSLDVGRLTFGVSIRARAGAARPFERVVVG